nr:hypothetical protein [uncultured Ruminococcus sp.]
MDKNSAKSEIKEKIGIDQIINEQMEQKNPDAISELNERDIEKIKRKMQAELERELDERLDQKIEEQVEQKLKEQERKEQLMKALKKGCTVLAASVAVCGAVLVAIRILKAVFGRRIWR